MAKTSRAQATAEVAARDPRLAELIERAGPLHPLSRRADGHFGALARTIMLQQLAGRAAQTIIGRVVEAVGGELTPEAIQATPDEHLRSAGLSANKLASLRDLSTKVLDGTVDLAPSSRRSDDDIIDNLTIVRGIGPWTAEMFLIYELRRFDVWPVGDLGVRHGYALIWGLDDVPTAEQLAPLGDKFRPYRSIVARYCWTALEVLKHDPAPVVDHQEAGPGVKPHRDGPSAAQTPRSRR